MSSITINTIAIGSNADYKRNAVEKVFGELMEGSFNIHTVDVESGVPQTPWDNDTFNGSRNRCDATALIYPDAKYVVGLESGLVLRYGCVYEETWCHIRNNLSVYGRGVSSGLRLPDYISNEMKTFNETHDVVMEKIRKRLRDKSKSKTHDTKDTWSTYSGGLISRQVSLQEAVRNALIELLYEETQL